MRVTTVAALLLAVLVGLMASPAAAQEPASVQGTGDAATAPKVGPGLYVDLIGEPETLWYAIDVAQGQQVAATVVVRGRAQGISTQNNELRVALLDSQRQASGEPAVGAFNGTVDTKLELVGQPLPAVGADGAYLTVTLASPTGANDLRDLGFQIEFAVATGGAAIPIEETVTARSSEPMFTTPEDTPAPAPATVADVLPVSLFAAALGGFGGYELTRRWMRHR